MAGRHSIDSGLFHVDLDDKSTYTFYYNIEKLVKGDLYKCLYGEDKNKSFKYKRFVINNKYMAGINSHVYDKIGFINYTRLPLDRSKEAIMGSMDSNNEMHFISRDQMIGIKKSVLAEYIDEIASMATYYCPKDTGYLANSIRLEVLSDGEARIYYDCPYAWYVHEFSWRHHEYPTRDHWLETAIHDVYLAHGLI